MDFSEALKLVKDGQRVRRRFWAAELGGKVGTHVALEDIPPLGTVLVCPGPQGKNPALFACSQWDILADDWEIAP